MLGAVLGALLAIALITQSAGATGMDAMMAKSDLSSSQDMPCGGCGGDDRSPVFSCVAPCLVAPAVLSSTTSDDAIALAVPVSRVSSTGTGQILAPDPNPPQL